MINTADLCDELGDRAFVAEPIFYNYGGSTSFHGQIATVKVFEDNTLVRATLETPGHGRVLVVDGGGSLRCALIGDQLAELAITQGWAGIIVYGCIRDSETIANMSIGLQALGTHPRKSVKKGEGTAAISVTFAGVTFIPGNWVVADEDGIVVCTCSPLE
ncbi:MAG: ribonuclease E activity regulator RraA [Betaproteobacteria bacterium]|nr:ribonuclease E activity regulator RraA [Betaproteobacteria bacterium]